MTQKKLEADCIDAMTTHGLRRFCKLLLLFRFQNFFKKTL